MTNETRREWVAVTRRYNKGMAALEHAMERLEQSVVGFDNPYQYEAATNAAVVELGKAARRLNDAYTADRKRLGVKVYSPYGSDYLSKG